MSNRIKLLVALCAMVAAVAAFQDARAGNANVTLQAEVEYFSVELEPGETLSYGGADEGAVFLIDDVTYSAWMEPTGRDTRARYFTVMDLDFTIQQIAAGQADLDYNFPAGRDHFMAVTRKWSEARGADFGAYLFETGPTGLTGTFDRFTHSTHSELLARQRMEMFKKFHFVAWLEGPDDEHASGTGPGSAGGGAGGEGIGIGAGLSSWASPTSQSRHYQTPQVVSIDNAVGFSVEAPATGSQPGLTAYTRARCNIKGRVIIGGEGLMVECADMLIGGLE